jgi:hypothetical protein
MSSDPTSPASRTPYRDVRKIVVAAGGSTIVLCGAALLPAPARTMALAMLAPLALIFLPSIIFAASKLRCPACQKVLPLGFSGAACPSCNAPLEVPPPPSARP